jgi:hypothetical protein
MLYIELARKRANYAWYRKGHRKGRNGQGKYSEQGLHISSICIMIGWWKSKAMQDR